MPKGSATNNETVALEAGRKRGMIKKSRYAALIYTIEQAIQEAGKIFFRLYNRLNME